MSRNDHGVSPLIIILIVLVVMTGVAAILVLRRHRAATRPADVAAARPLLSPAQKAYLPSIEIGGLHMSAANNFLGDTVTYLDGTVTNKGSRAVRDLEVELNFVDTLDQVVLRETAHPLAGRGKPLQPGETYPFRVTFEHMPVDWNQAPPNAKAVYVEF